MSWGKTFSATSSMAVKMPCLSDEIIIIGKSVMMLNQVVMVIPRLRGKIERRRKSRKMSQPDLFQIVPTTDTGGLVE